MKTGKRIVCLILTVLCVLTVVMAGGTAVMAKSVTHRETVSILNPKQNMRGDGYEWQNRYDKLILTDLRIDTEDDYGLKITDGAVVYLNGDNYIKASKAAIYCGGTVTFRGNGTLTLVSEETGILSLTDMDTKRIRVIEGTYTIQAGKTGIRADHSEIILVGGQMDITVGDPAGYAVDGYITTVNSGVTLKADNALRGTYKLNVSDAKLDITAPQTALQCDGYFTLAKVHLKTGADPSAMKAATEYQGENCVSTVSSVVKRTSSILFGEKYPIALDIVLLVAAILALLAVVIVPTAVKKYKTQKFIEARDAARAAEKQKQKSVSGKTV